MYFYFDDLAWWLIILINLIGFFIFMFGVKFEAILKERNPILEFLQFLGGIIILASFAAMFLAFGIRAGLMFIPIFWFIITPIVGTLIELVQKKMVRSI